MNTFIRIKQHKKRKKEQQEQQYVAVQWYFVCQCVNYTRASYCVDDYL